MRYLSLIIVLLISSNMSFGYDNHETNMFVEDCKQLIGDRDNWESVQSATRALYFIEGSFQSEDFIISKMLLMGNVDDLTLEQLEEKRDSLLAAIREYSLPSTANPAVMAKVLIKYSENNPAELTLSPLIFMQAAFADAWGTIED